MAVCVQAYTHVHAYAHITEHKYQDNVSTLIVL